MADRPATVRPAHSGLFGEGEPFAAEAGGALIVLVSIEAIAALAAIVLMLRPLREAFGALVAEVKACPPVVRGMLGAAVVGGVVLRSVVAHPAVLYPLPGAAHMLDRLFFPLGPSANWYPHHGMGAAVLNAAFGAVFGPQLEVLFAINIVASSLAIPLLFLFARELTGSRLTAAFAAFVMAFYVPAVRVDVSDQLVALSTMTFLLAGWSVLSALRRPGRDAFLLAGFALAAAAQFRLEMVIHLGALALLVLLSSARLRQHVPAVFRGLGVFLLLSLPRMIVTGLESLRLAPEAPAWRGDFFFGVFFSEWNAWLNPTYTAPLLVLLCIVGIVWLLRERRLRESAFLGVAIVGSVLFCFNEWMLDLGDALRFQANVWPHVAVLAGIGLAGSVERLRHRGAAAAVTAIAVTLPVIWVVPGLPLLREPQPNEVDLQFLQTNGRALPPECNLLVQGEMLSPPGAQGGRVHRTGWRPGWLGGRTGTDVLPRFPQELPDNPGEACHVAYVGVDCFRWYPDEIVPDREIQEAFLVEDREPLYAMMGRIRERLDRDPPPQPRPECAELFDRFEMEPLVTATLPPARPSSVWSPPGDMEIGMYRLKPAARPAGDDGGEQDVPEAAALD